MMITTMLAASLATFIKIITDYADRLAGADGRLYLSGLQPDLTERLRRTGSIQGPLRAVEAHPRHRRIHPHRLPRRRSLAGQETHRTGLKRSATAARHDTPRRAWGAAG